MTNCCGKCWAEFKGWLKAFTPLESLLTIIEALFLILFIVFIVLLILHFLACGNETDSNITTKPSSITTPVPYTTSSSESKALIIKTRPKCTYTTDAVEILTESMNERLANNVTRVMNESRVTQSVSTVSDYDVTAVDPEVLAADLSDGVLADDDERQVVLALVKVKPSGLTFGCILTVVAQHWTVTAASCVDSIEEVDSLDNFVMLDDYGEAQKGRSHPVSDVRVHPLYEAGNSSHDLALLRTDDALSRQPVMLPSLLEYHRLVVGGTAHLLGFGHFRSIDHSASGRRVHSASVHLLPAAHCQVQQLEERHLLPVEQQASARCTTAPLCFGVLYARGTPCNYCAGAPLLRRRTLLGVMADNGQCGAACEPALYANMAAVADWMRGVVA